MHISLRAIVPLLVLCATPTVVVAQLGFPGGVRSSPRPLVEEAREPDDGAGLLVGGAQRTWLLGTAGNASEAGTGFSALGGLSVELDESLSVEGTLSYQRSMPEDLDATNAFGATVELGRSHKISDDALVLSYAASGEGVWKEQDRGYTAAVSGSATLRSLVELGGNLAYQGSDPDVGDTEWELVPGLSAAFFPTENSSVGVDYTFDNDLDGKESYEAFVTYSVTRVARPFQLRLGVDDEEVFGLAIIFKLRPTPTAAGGDGAPRPGSR